MNIRSRVGAAAACTLAFVFVVVAGVGAQKDQKETKKLDKTQIEQAQALSQAIDQAEAGQSPASDVPLALQSCHFFRTATGDTYVPFTITVDAKAMSSPGVVLLYRVVDRNAPKPIGPAAAQDKDKNKDKTPVVRVRPAYEDLAFTAFKPGALGDPLRLSRAFQAPAGDYDLYVALLERNQAVDKKQKPKITVLKQPVTVPDLKQELSTSSIVLPEKIDQLPLPLPPDQQRDNPYTMGQLQIVPRLGTKFAKTQELSVYFQVYNEALDAAKKPDIQIEFLFYRKQADSEKKIASSEPQILNASTLPPQFDPTKHQLAGGSAWPLTTFQPGDFRLEITVTDKVSGKILKKSVDFTVS